MHGNIFKLLDQQPDQSGAPVCHSSKTNIAPALDLTTTHEAAVLSRCKVGNSQLAGLGKGTGSSQVHMQSWCWPDCLHTFG